MLLRLKAEYDDLVNEILDKIPQNKLIHGKVLDPSMGGGQFMKEIERRKREAGLSLDKIKNTCYGYADGQLALNYVINKHGLVGTYKIGNFLEEDIDMKFDVIVCNPPYQDSLNKAKNNKLWHKFILHNFNLAKGGVIAFVNPKSMFSGVGISNKIVEKYTTDYSLKHVVSHDTYKSSPFPTVGIETCHWIATHEQYDGKTNFNGNIVDIRNISSTFTESQLIEKSILDKISSYTKKIKFLCPDISENNGTYEYLISGNKRKMLSSTSPIHENMLKYVVSFSSSYSNQFITKENVAKFNKYVLINDTNDELNLRSFMLSKLMIFYANKYQKTAGFTPAVKNNMIPDLREKKWTDAELYKHFNLTKEEIDLIESSVK